MRSVKGTLNFLLFSRSVPSGPLLVHFGPGCYTINGHVYQFRGFGNVGYDTIDVVAYVSEYFSFGYSDGSVLSLFNRIGISTGSSTGSSDGYLGMSANSLQEARRMLKKVESYYDKKRNGINKKSKYKTSI